MEGNDWLKGAAENSHILWEKNGFPSFLEISSWVSQSIESRTCPTCPKKWRWLPKTPYCWLHLPLSHDYPNIIPLSPKLRTGCHPGRGRKAGGSRFSCHLGTTWGCRKTGPPMMASGDKGKMMVNRSTSGWTNFWVPYFRPKKLTPRNDITMLIILIMFLGIGWRENVQETPWNSCENHGFLIVLPLNFECSYDALSTPPRAAGPDRCHAAGVVLHWRCQGHQPTLRHLVVGGYPPWRGNRERDLGILKMCTQNHAFQY